MPRRRRVRDEFNSILPNPNYTLRAVRNRFRRSRVADDTPVAIPISSIPQTPTRVVDITHSTLRRHRDETQPMIQRVLDGVDRFFGHEPITYEFLPRNDDIIHTAGLPYGYYYHIQRNGRAKLRGPDGNKIKYTTAEYAPTSTEVIGRFI